MAVGPAPQPRCGLVQLNPDVMVIATTPGALAAQQATTTIPIVVAVSEDFVAEGIVASLARPGGDITGQHPGIPSSRANA